MTDSHKPTAAQLLRQKQRAQFDRLTASLKVPQHTRLVHDLPTKQRPALGRFATI